MVHHEPQAHPGPDDEHCVLGCSVHHEAKGVLEVHDAPCVQPNSVLYVAGLGES